MRLRGACDFNLVETETSLQAGYLDGLFVCSSTWPPSTHSSPAYEACAEGAGLVDRSELGKLLLTGEQAREFLDGQVSQRDRDARAEGHGRYAALLTNKGRMLGDLRVVATEATACCSSDRARRAAGALRPGPPRPDRLARRAAQAHARSSGCSRSSARAPTRSPARPACRIPGPRSEHDVRTPAAPPGRRGRAHRRRASTSCRPPSGRRGCARRCWTPAPSRRRRPPRRSCASSTAGRATASTSTRRVMPEEAGIVDRAVSFTKGCYVGQETVARLHWKGKPNRHLRAAAAGRARRARATRSPPASGKDVGRVGSAVVSPRLGPIALALRAPRGRRRRPRRGRRGGVEAEVADAAPAARA